MDTLPLLVLSLLVCSEAATGARLLKQTSSSASATVQGGPGTTGKIQLGLSGPQGSFSQTTPVSGPTTVQFSSEDGGTLVLKGPDGQTQSFSSVIGPPGTPVPQIPSVPVIAPVPTVVFSGVPPIPNLASSVDFQSLDPSLAQKINARLEEWFRALRKSGPYLAPGSSGTYVGMQSAAVTSAGTSTTPISQGVSVQARSTSGGGVVAPALAPAQVAPALAPAQVAPAPAPAQVASVPQSGAVLTQQTNGQSRLGSSGDSQTVQVSATAAGPTSIGLRSSSVTTG